MSEIDSSLRTKVKKHHPVYLFHLLFILLLWTGLFAAMFYFPMTAPAMMSVRIFNIACALAAALAAAALVLLRIGALSTDPARMFRRTAAGDLLLVLALGVAGPVFWLVRDQILFICALLGAVLILQTHVPLLDDEDLDPPGLKEHLPAAAADEPKE
jgi:hypothetical protein